MHKNEPLLSTRERRIIALLADGYATNAIASQVQLSGPEVQHKIQKILQKRGFDNPFQLITWAYREGIIT